MTDPKSAAASGVAATFPEANANTAAPRQPEGRPQPVNAALDEAMNGPSSFAAAQAVAESCLHPLDEPFACVSCIMVALDKVDQFHAHAQPADAATLGPDARGPSMAQCWCGGPGMAPGHEGPHLAAAVPPAQDARPDALRDEALGALRALVKDTGWMNHHTHRLPNENLKKAEALLDREDARAVLRRRGR